MTKKKITPITTGETIFPKNKPNLNHNLFKELKTKEFFNPRIKKIKESVKKIAKNKVDLNKQNILNVKKTKKKVIPKFLFDG